MPDRLLLESLILVHTDYITHTVTRDGTRLLMLFTAFTDAA